jgi:hypothetical protein
MVLSSATAINLLILAKSSMRFGSLVVYLTKAARAPADSPPRRPSLYNRYEDPTPVDYEGEHLLYAAKVRNAFVPLVRREVQPSSKDWKPTLARLLISLRRSGPNGR